MTLYVIFASGKFTQTINGEPMTGDRTELISAYHSFEAAEKVLKSGKADVAEPDKWGLRCIGIESVELKDLPVPS